MASDDKMIFQGSGNRELAQFAFEKGMKSAGLTPVALNIDSRCAQVAMIPEGMHLEDLKPFLPDTPDMKHEDRKLLSVESFIGYVNEQKRPESRIFATIETAPVTFVCIVDHHGPNTDNHRGAAGWGEQVIKLELQAAREFKTWKGVDGKLLSQLEFVEFLKDNRTDIAEPSGADILQLCMALEATSESRCVGKVPTNTGMTFSYDQNTRTNVPVPNALKLRIPLFAGMAALDVEAEFRFRVSQGGGLTFGIRMIGAEKLLRNAVDEARKTITAETGLPVYV